MAIAATKSLVAAIAAGGWVAVVAILIICMVGLLVTSAFGIFFSSESGTGQSMSQVITEINAEYTAEIDRIKQDNPHDDVMLTGNRAPWKEVLAVYAVKTTTAQSGAMEVVTVDSERKELIRTIFWDMNSVTSRVEDREATEIIAVDDGNGGFTEEYQTTTVKTLYVVQHAESADEMAIQYGFDTEQAALLHELLQPDYDSLWQSVLYGIHSGSGDIVEVAITQLGNVGGQPYWSWYGFGGRVEWCACFVSWCANKCGYIEAGVVPKFSYCPTGVQWFKDAGLWQDRGYVPHPGDIIFFDWGSDGVSDHVGIVESCDGSTIYTIEGNSSDACRRNSYSVNSSSVMGFGLLRQ
jgi:cell wall-associated NlpC family hydrolase